MAPGEEQAESARLLGKELRRVAAMPITRGRGETLRKRIVKHHNEMPRC